MFSAESPYFFISSDGVPDSPNESSTPTNSMGTKLFLTRSPEIDSPKPPIILCSSAETMQLVFETEFKIISWSSGLIV